MNFKRIVTGALALLCMSASVVAEIQAGRAIQITIGGVPPEEKGKFDSMYPVSESGTINMPYVGEVRAAGLKAEQLAASLEARYKAAKIYTHPTFQVFDSSQKSIEQQTVVVGGQVGRAGPVPYNRNLTLWQAIQSAGGPTPFGSMKRVRLLRGKSMKQYDVTKPQFMQIPLEPDDIIDVPQKTPWGG